MSRDKGAKEKILQETRTLQQAAALLACVQHAALYGQ